MLCKKLVCASYEVSLCFVRCGFVLCTKSVRASYEVGACGTRSWLMLRTKLVRALYIQSFPEKFMSKRKHIFRAYYTIVSARIDPCLSLEMQCPVGISVNFCARIPLSFMNPRKYLVSCTVTFPDFIFVVAGNKLPWLTT